MIGLLVATHVDGKIILFEKDGSNMLRVFYPSPLLAGNHPLYGGQEVLLDTTGVSISDYVEHVGDQLGSLFCSNRELNP